MHPRFRFIGSLTEYKNSDYVRAINTYMEKARKSQDVVSVYQIGSIGAPGLSDIDLIIVLKDKPKHFTWKEFSIKNLSNKNQYIFLHEPYVIQESLMPFIKFLFYISDLKLIYGKGFNFKPSEKEVYLHTLLNNFIYGYILWPERTVRKKHLKYRELLPLINSVKFTINLFNLVMKESDFTKMQNSYLERNDYLRKSFFNLSREEKQTLISDIIFDAVKINDMIADKIHNFIIEKLLSIKTTRIYFGLFPKRIVIFKNKIKREGVFLRFLPSSFSIMLNEKDYNKIKDKRYENAFRKRMSLLKEYENFIFTNRLSRFMKFPMLHIMKL